MDVMEFFERSSGLWRSQRTTHHLPFRRVEKGASEIEVEALSMDHPKVLEICELHQVDPGLAVGGAYVSWAGSMDWDREDDENHIGSTVFVLVPDAENPQQGNLLRERGYAEIVPVIGRYQMDDEDGLVLTTEYETMSSTERFWFASPELRLRASTVKRFGGFSTATFCTEFRVAAAEASQESGDRPSSSAQIQDAFQSGESYSVLGW